MKVSDDEKTHMVKLRYRGDQINHWLFEKKSLRIKLTGYDQYDMHKKFNLINPPMISAIVDVINHSKAKDLGLISPEYYPVRVFINGEYSGLYYFLSQVDESLLRNIKRMPGSIYRGDFGPYNTKDKNNVSTLWRDERAWQKTAARNSEQANNRDDIRYFINSINTFNDIEFFEFFNDFLDKEKYYSFFALDVIFGSAHHDYAHNHYLYFDPYKGKFEPIEWDMRYWSEVNYKDESIYPLLNRVRLNPILEAERDKFTYNILLNNNHFSEESLRDRLDELNNDIDGDLKSDIYRDKAGIGLHNKIMGNMWYATTFNMEEHYNSNKTLKNRIGIRRKYLTNIYNDTKLKFNITHSQENSVITFSVDNNTPVAFKTKNGKVIFRDLNFNGVIDESDTVINSGDIMYPGRKWKTGLFKNRPAFLFGNKHIIYSHLNYQYISTDNDLNIDDFTFTNYITGNMVLPTNEKPLDDSNTDSVHPWSMTNPKHTKETLKGVIHVKKTLVFDKYKTIRIEPGTIFLMHKGASIFFYGKVLALGTKEKPIKFLAENNDDPWGLVAVQGKATTGSKFEYVEFINGSIDTRNLIQYTAPFNIHDTDWFEVRNCKVGKNHIGDDSMHVAYAKGIISKCEFTDARSDALDIDISEVTVKNNIFHNSGNDALDIMTTKMEAFNNVFIKTGDKGISVGEWSEAVITNSLLIDNEIGIEVKDKSTVAADNLLIINAKTKAINLYNKNKRYDEGGSIKGNNIYLVNNTEVKADKRSSATELNIIENKLPDLSDFQWFIDNKNSRYMNILNKVYAKHAQ